MNYFIKMVLFTFCITINYVKETYSEDVKDYDYIPFQAKPLCKRSLRVQFYGDIFIGMNKKNPYYYFEDVKPLFTAKDVFHVANLEGAITTVKKPFFSDKQYSLRMPVEVGEVLKTYNINYVTRANNHTMDFGYEGVEETNRVLDEHGIKWSGVGENLSKALEPIVLERNNIRVAIFSLTTTQPYGAWAQAQRPGVAAPLFDNVLKVLSEAKKNFDFVVAVYHWGTELEIMPHEHQVSLARALVKNAKVDLIVGHHAHVAQKIERYKNTWIVYGLGNFIFTSTSDKSKLSLISAVEFCKDDEDYSVTPFFTPINTQKSKEDKLTRPYSLKDFIVYSKEYREKNSFHDDSVFYFPFEQAKYSFSSLKKMQNKTLP